MAKKQKKTTPEQVPTKRQLSKWQRQMKIRRIVIIAAVVFLVGISSWVGYGYYQDYRASTAAWREVMIEVNGVPFTMEYFVKTLDAYTKSINSTILQYYGSYFANLVADNIIDAELIRQGAKEELGIEVTAQEISAELEEQGFPNNRIYQDIVRTVLLEEKVKEEYFGPTVGNTTLQAHVQAMLVESQEVATQLIAEIEAGVNFTSLIGVYSCNSSVKGDLGWLPEELMPNALIANAAFNFTPGETGSIYDEAAVKEVAYWLIKVTGKQDNEIDALVMLLGSEAQAEQIKAELAAGGNFSALAQQYSQHSSKSKGGNLTGLKPGDMGSAIFDTAAFNATINIVSDPVKDKFFKTAGGYWLVRVLERGEHELTEETRDDLIDWRYNDWRQEFAGKSTIKTYLEANKITWAINKVLEDR